MRSMVGIPVVLALRPSFKSVPASFAASEMADGGSKKVLFSATLNLRM